MVRISIVIPTFNCLDTLRECLLSLGWIEDEGVDIVVADAGSADGTCELAKAVPGVHVVAGDPSMWWAATTNLGCSQAIERLGARVLCLLNADCTWDQESFRSLCICSSSTRGISWPPRCWPRTLAR